MKSATDRKSRYNGERMSLSLQSTLKRCSIGITTGKQSLSNCLLLWNVLIGDQGNH